MRRDCRRRDRDRYAHQGKRVWAEIYRQKPLARFWELGAPTTVLYPAIDAFIEDNINM